MKFLKGGLYFTAMLALLAVAIFFLRAADTADHVSDLAVESQKRVADTSSNVNALLIQLGLTADNVRRASEQQQVVSAKTIAILNHADDLITQTKANEDQISAHTVQAIDALPPVLNELKVTTAHADKIITDPNITAMMTDMQKSAAQAAGAMKNVNDTTADLKKKADDLLKPASLSVRIATWTLRGLAALRDAFVIF